MYTETRAGTRKTHICDHVTGMLKTGMNEGFVFVEAPVAENPLQHTRWLHFLRYTGKQDGGGPGEVRGSQGGCSHCKKCAHVKHRFSSSIS